MRSRADRSRATVERALRGAAFALIAWALWRVATAASRTRPLMLDGRSMNAAWPALLDGSPVAAHLRVGARLPADSTRDLLAAAARAGVLVRWSGGPAAPLALSADRLREPEHPLQLRVVGAGPVVLRDARSTLDSAADASSGATLIMRAADGMIRADAGAASARVLPASAGPLHPVLVIGRASWETKFIVAALEEQGWVVEARIAVAPTAEVTSGTRHPLDTAHYAAVVAVDSAASALALSPYVRSGGGVVLLVEAARVGAFREWLPATPGARRSSAKRSFDPTDPLGSLAVTPLEALRDDAASLETRGGITTVAARRERAGRVLMVGYDESWHWRLEGGDDAVGEHRRWWSRLVGAVAAGDGAGADGTEGAPAARWVDALGAPTTRVPDGAPAEPLPQWLLPVLCIILLTEWGSRRLRGAR